MSLRESFASFDTETTGLDVYKGDRIFSYCLSFPDGDGIRTEIHRIDRSEQERKRGLDRLQKFFDDTSIIKIGHNIKFDLSFAKADGIVIPENTIIEDTMIQSQILNNLSPSHKLDDLMFKLRGIHKPEGDKVKRMASAWGGYHKVPDHIMRKYQIGDGENTLLLWMLFNPKIKSDPILYLDYRNEMDLIIETIHMESSGLRISPRECNKLIEWLETELEQVNKRCISLFGHLPNLGSPSEVNYYLYKKLKLPVLKKTKGGSNSSDKFVLLELRENYYHEFIDLVMKYRSYTSGLTKVDSYLRFATTDGVIHPEILTNEAKTGRQSSKNPPLQNVSKAKNLLNPFPVPLRRIFICQPGHVMPLVDYAGIELRLIIDRAEEESLIQALLRDEDPHVLLSKLWYADHVPPAMRWSLVNAAMQKVLRGSGKNADFALPYGASATKLAATLGLSLPETVIGLRAIKNQFPRYANFVSIAAKRVEELGYIITAFGRKLYVSRAEAYAGANYDIQGTAAGILKRAQVGVGKYLRKNWPEVRMALPIHDELIFNYPRSHLQYAPEIIPAISSIMTTRPEIRAPLKVEWKLTTTNWDSAREYSFER